MTLRAAVTTALDHECRLAAACWAVQRPEIPAPTPGRPPWWDMLSVPMRALGEQAIKRWGWAPPGGGA